MANLVKALKSGAEVEIQVASFEKAHRLLQAVKGSDIKMDGTVDRLVSLVLNPDVQPCLWDCMGVCLYNRKRIDRDTFEPVSARGDYLFVAQEVLAANLVPFVASLASQLSVSPDNLTSGDQK